MAPVLQIASYYSKEAEKFSDDNKPRWYFSGVYLHGEMEDIVHYDICYPTNPEDFPGCVVDITTKFNDGLDSEGSNKYRYVTHPYLFLDGVFPCIVDGKYECTAFLWYDHEDVESGHCNAYTMRGLIVLNTDTESLANARMAYLIRKSYL